MKLRIALQLLAGFALGYIMCAFVGIEKAAYILALIPLLGLAHEALHLVAIKILGLRSKFSINGLYLGFNTFFHYPGQFMVAAIAPQIITLVLLTLYSLTVNPLILLLLLVHLAISCEDLAKVVKYILAYFI
uniref:DUF3267 domain-containing protein n=1 Tax=Ignisphaera aggregans TaxID=334771 RepID=A0A7C2VDL8_9CREN